MTWNVWWRFGDDWEGREGAIRATVDDCRPDLLGLVESWSGDGTDQPHRLAADLGMHAVWVPASLPSVPHPDHPGVGFGLGLLSRWPVSATWRELPHAQRGGPPPTVLLATVDHPDGPLHVLVAGTEWEDRFAGDHLAQCRELAALATDPSLDGPLPVLLIGDLNAEPGQSELDPVLDAMTDTWTLAGGDPAAITFDSSLPIAEPGAEKQFDRRIDHVFARPGRPGAPLRATRAVIAGDRPIDGVYPSDHYAVVVDLEP